MAKEFTLDRKVILKNHSIDGGQAGPRQWMTVPAGTTAELASLPRREGALAYDTTLNAVVFDNGSSFAPIADGTGMDLDFGNAQPSVVDIDLDGNKVVNLGAPTDDSDAATKEYVDDEIAAIPTPVESLNTLTGDIVLAAGTNISLTPVGNTITIASSAAGANTNLSNLISPTQVNQDLLPDVDTARNLGSQPARWGQIYVTTIRDDANTTGDAAEVLTANGDGTFTWAPASGGTPTGDPNTVAIFDSAGDLASNVDFIFDETTMAQSYGVKQNSGTIQALGNGALAHGNVDNSGNIAAGGAGAHASGAANDSAQIGASSTASVARGFVDGAGSSLEATADAASAIGTANTGAEIVAQGTASEARGVAQTDGVIQSLGDSSLAHGNAIDQATISASGTGATASGYSEGLNSSLNAANEGSQARGRVLAGGLVEAGDVAALAHGDVDNSTGTGLTRVQAQGPASHAHGVATQDGVVQSQGTASHAHGVADDSGVVNSTFESSYAHGSASGSGSRIESSNVGASAHGQAFGGSAIEASGVGSLAFGDVANASSMTASSVGALVFGGVTNGGVIESTNGGTLAGGYADDGSISAGNSLGAATMAHGYIESGSGTGNITATQRGSRAFGYVNGTGTISASSQAAIAIGSAHSLSTINAGGSDAAFGSLAHGFAESNGFVRTQSGHGSQAHGYASGASAIQTNGDGATAQGVSLSNGLLEASGDGSFANGAVTDAGSVIRADGLGSIAMGRAEASSEINANVTGSFAGGYALNNNNIQNGGEGSFVWGTTDVGSVSTGGNGAIVVGTDSSSSGNYSSSFGVGHANISYAATAIGRYPVAAGTSNSWVSTDPVFTIGNGASNVSRADAYRIDKDGRIHETAAKSVAIRVLTTSDTLSARTDHKIILDDQAAGTNTITLPAGEDGLMFVIVNSQANTGTWTLTPDGTDVLDPLVPTNPAVGAPVPITFIGGVWYYI